VSLWERAGRGEGWQSAYAALYALNEVLALELCCELFGISSPCWPGKHRHGINIAAALNQLIN
jgi:hypothetical protein